MNNKFTAKAQEALRLTLASASELGHSYIGTEHLLLGLSREGSGIAAEHLKAHGITSKAISEAIVALTGKGDPTAVSAAEMTPRVKSIIQASHVEAQKHGSLSIGTEHLLVALLYNEDCVGAKILDHLHVSPSELRAELIAFLASSSGSEHVGNAAEAHTSTDGALSHAQALKGYGRNLNELASAGRIDPIIGRENETERLIQILSRRTKNNPCLIGEPGVGKTAVVEGLAQRIVSGNVPENLLDKTIVTLDVASMIAGAKYRGEFEERFKGVMDEVRKNPHIILFIDEIHTLVGAGAAEGALDAANIIKPALARGEMQLIGATTISEYRKHIEKDAALERRFQSVLVGEPTKEDTLHILRGLREKYETHHKLKISDEAIEAAVNLSVRYITDRYLPDKAIDLIDEAASRLRIHALTSPPDLRGLEERLKTLSKEKEEAISSQEFEKAATLRDEEQKVKKDYEEKRDTWSRSQKEQALTVRDTDIADVVTQWTGIPVNRLLEEEGEKLLHLDEMLRERVIGQDEAVEAIAKAIRRGRMGLKDPRRPVGSFIFRNDPLGYVRIYGASQCFQADRITSRLRWL